MAATRTEIPDDARLGKYLLLTRLGAGGMADVSLAALHGPGGCNKLLVIKQIQERWAEDPDFVTMFLDEARLAARLQHPNVVQTNEVGQEDGRYFMAMEYLEGQSLGRVRARLGRRALPLRVHLQVLADVLAGLHYAHELVDYDQTPLNVVHRDANPENVFITYTGVVKVLDFGIAKARDQCTETVAGTIKGKVTYMPPEQARGEHLDRRADVFAVGVMLWEAATGMRMWAGLPATAILQSLLARDIVPPRQVCPDVPDQLDAIIRKALSPDREDRHATAAELQTDIELYLAEIGGRLPPRELGQLVASHFEVERARIRTRIQERIHDADRPLVAPSPLPVTRVSTTDFAPADASTPASAPAAFAMRISSVTPGRARRGLAAVGIGVGALALTLATSSVPWRAPRPAPVAAAGAPTAAALVSIAEVSAPPPPVSAVTLAPPAPTSTATTTASPAIRRAMPSASAKAPLKTAPRGRGQRRLDDANPYTTPR